MADRDSSTGRDAVAAAGASMATVRMLAGNGRVSLHAGVQFHAGVHASVAGGAPPCIQTIIETSIEEAPLPPKAAKPAGAVKPPKPTVTLEADAAGVLGFQVPEVLQAQWAASFPGVDVPGEIRRAGAWATHSGVRMTAADSGRFLRAWMLRASHGVRARPVLSLVRTAEVAHA